MLENKLQSYLYCIYSDIVSENAVSLQIGDKNDNSIMKMLIWLLMSLNSLRTNVHSGLLNFNLYLKSSMENERKEALNFDDGDLELENKTLHKKFILL